VRAGEILDDWLDAGRAFVKVMPRDYRRVLEVMASAEAEGLDAEATAKRIMEASHG
jgi:glutamate synthase domain-containing protein 3